MEEILLSGFAYENDEKTRENLERVANDRACEPNRARI
jgi:hypothetical protein